MLSALSFFTFILKINHLPRWRDMSENDNLTIFKIALAARSLIMVNSKR